MELKSNRRRIYMAEHAVSGTASSKVLQCNLGCRRHCCQVCLLVLQSKILVIIAAKESVDWRAGLKLKHELGLAIC